VVKILRNETLATVSSSIAILMNVIWNLLYAKIPYLVGLALGERIVDIQTLRDRSCRIAYSNQEMPTVQHLPWSVIRSKG
jgi:hypothetical protein